MCMSKDMVTVRNRDTGKVGVYPRKLVDHKIFGARLEIVPAGTKPKVPLGGGKLEVPSAEPEEAPKIKPSDIKPMKKDEEK